MYREEMLERLAAGEDPLELSIQKYKDIIACLESITDIQQFNWKLQESAWNCALCECYLPVYGDSTEDCVNCPVYEVTGVTGCYKTPYYEAKDTLRYNDIENAVIAHKKELAFLESLRPKKESEECQP